MAGRKNNIRFKRWKLLATILMGAFCLFTTFTAKAQQDAQFSQYVFNGLYINPAYAGYKQDVYLSGFYRSQWTGLDGAPQTFSLAADAAVADERVGLGLMISQDRIGAQSSLAVYGNYAYKIQIGDNESSKLSFGLGAGFIQNGLDGSKLHAGQPGDEYVPVGSQSFILPDARLGVLYTNNDWFAGFSADNMVAHFAKGLKSTTISVPVPQPHYYLTAGAMIPLDEGVKLKPSFLIKDDRAGPTSLDLNLFMLLGERIWIGSTYRTAIPSWDKSNLQQSLQKANAVVGMIEFFATEKLRIGYAFDYSLTALSNYSYGSHELSIGIYLRHGRERSNFNRCYF
ncbi:PorP/SprF family type IX secretion system membrane protein [Mucilaginibacter agri]|nr:type IX secretion system membrane protein PorP/SprF [Mucilaginibacter agri]